MNGVNGSHWTRGYSLKGLKQQQSVDAATDYFMKGYERPGIPHADRRRQRARAVKQQLDKLAVPEIAILNCRHKGIISIMDPNQSTKSAIYRQMPLAARFPSPWPRTFLLIKFMR